jgi:hypothetical protein
MLVQVEARALRAQVALQVQVVQVVVQVQVELLPIMLVHLRIV